MSITDYGTVVICGAPESRISRFEALGERWCFHCRKRQNFALIVREPVVMSYYGPTPSVECAEGHIDGDCFPGRYREWNE